MSAAANPNPASQPPWASAPWQQQPWHQPSYWPPFWHPAGLSRPAGVAIMVLGFALWWPAGLAVLAFLLATGLLGCRRRDWANNPSAAQGQAMAPPWANWCRPDNRQRSSSGNHAFDEYRAETIRRLEEEQNDFASFLERLRFAKDKAEFDQFMAERRQGAQSQPPRPPGESGDRPQV